MWNISAWDEVRRFFPDNKNGSRIVITTRLSYLASCLLTNYYCLEMKFLDEEKSWNLLCKTVFGEEGCPVKLEKIGKKIARNCRGLPLSIVVIGGILVKSNLSHGYWEYIAENLNSLVNSDDGERCLKILYMSYKEMPVYLKSSFLYIGIFSEDSVIGATTLNRLWVADGFLKPKSGKSLEEIAEGCLEELTDRNLVRATRRLWKIKHCNIHDLLRDLCLREAQKERFYSGTKEITFNDSKGITTQRRIVISRRVFKKGEVEELQSMSLARSFICDDGVGFLTWSTNYRLLRILNTSERNLGNPKQRCLLEDVFHLVNSRYLAIHVNDSSKFPASVCFLWNLHTLIVFTESFLTAPSEIWMMHQLRHVKFDCGLYLPHPPRRIIARKDDVIVLSNLQSLSTIANFKCGEEVIKRIPNVKKLGLHFSEVGRSTHYFLKNLDRLHKLESFRFSSFLVQFPEASDILLRLSLPHSLKKLTLEVLYVKWDDIMEKIGSLPLLEVLRLRRGFFRGCVWETVEGQFSSLKSLGISCMHDLQYWKSESTHFPCLGQLVLQDLHELKEIPSGIGEIPTLQSIELDRCSYSAVISAKKDTRGSRGIRRRNTTCSSSSLE